MAFIVFSFLLYSHIFFTPADQFSPAYSEEIATNYGPSCTSETPDGRVWMGHTLSRFTRSSLIRGLPIISSATQNLTDADSVPSRHVRISRFQFSYALQVNPGQKLIRLHFNPASYRGFRKHKDLFTVEADRFTLLGNFSASLTADALGLKYLVKEFCINVEKNQTLKLKFAPVHSLLHDTYAFVNGIEIIDLPGPLYYSHDGHLGAQLIGHKHRVFIENSTALEMVHYLHFRETSVPQANTSGMLWSMATRKSNKINNFAWRIPVDVGFGYLVRLHLSELQIYMVDMEFSVLIDGKVADTKADSAGWRSHNNTHQYRDYVVIMNRHEQEDRRDLVISLKSKGGICDGPLTGFEILKLSNLDNSLASPNPSPPSQSSPFRCLKKFILQVVFGYGSVVAGVVASVITLANTIAYKMNKQRALTEGLRRFSLAEIRSATENFNSACFIGRGGYGTVYGGCIDDGQLEVAIKRLSSYSHQGEREFWTEVKALSKLRHTNLVSLIGYCNESREMILVYEFMPLGTLGVNLYKNAKTDKSLSWEQRLRICIGAARGFDYLHTGTDHEVIHRDVKSSNILLDKEFKAKISDFGLAKIRECVELPSHVSTMVKGTPGYMDPAYRTSRQLTKKSDVYSFGVVLFEVLCGRKAVSSRDQENQPDLISWARCLIRDGHIDQIVDSRLNGQISPKCLKAFVDISEKCLHDDPKKRPTMVKLVAQLELLLEAHVRKTDAEMVQDLEAPAIVAQPNILEAPPGGTRPNTRETSSNNSSSFGLWPREPHRRSKELIFSDGPCHCFSISDIVSATENFSNDNIMMHDGLYRIYRGSCYPPSKGHHIMYKGHYTPKFLAINVLVARLNCAEEGMPDISTELEKLSYLDHSNLASMVGYCCSDGEMIIVYEHNGRSTLLQHLNRSDLSWRHKLNICIGAARALRYLHMGTGVKIIHGDISPTTIFLDDDSGAKVVNFGTILSNMNTRNAGELEHMPPDFADSTKLTEKSDVYLFGLLLLVVLCGKNAYYNYRLGRYPLHLPDKVREAIKKKNLHRITDLNPEVDIAEECLNEFLEIAFSCLRHKQVDRPSMDTVVEGLEGALSLQWVAETHINQQSYITSSY